MMAHALGVFRGCGCGCGWSVAKRYIKEGIPRSPSTGCSPPSQFTSAAGRHLSGNPA